MCRKLALIDPHLATVLTTYGLPPLWNREPSFATLLLIILEQQVSLASAKACFTKLEMRVSEVTPKRILNSTDDELRIDGFSRQKTAYARELAAAIIEKRISLPGLNRMPDDEARGELMKLKGIGNWTADIYLLMALLRADIMPRGDLALHAAYQTLTESPKRPSADDFLEIAERWSPYRSAAARLLWHFYLAERNKRKKNP